MPWFPLMGEFHYSRYKKEEWEKELYKIKAGGIDIVASYIIWIHHEEIEGQMKWEDNCDLRTFVLLAKKCGLKVWLRIGPWVHGEVRNGGFPDWLLKKPFTPRSNDTKYFSYVRRFYQEIYHQVAGLLVKDDGPILGIQIENEYHGCQGMTMQEQEIHMGYLYTIAKEIGLDTPYTTATGWGNSATGGLLPVMGGYCEAPWDERVTELEPSGNYIFTKERNDANIGTDLHLGEGISYDYTLFPFLTAELGGGVQVTKHRRPRISGKDIGAMSLVKLGCGASLLGYYMYHGGTNPVGKLSTMQESKATGYPNDYPELSYDFMAPIGEYGQVREAYREIRLLSMFVKDFSEEFTQMELIIPKDNDITPWDKETLRYAYYEGERSGYLFFNNYVRRQRMKNHSKVQLVLEGKNQTITFAPTCMEDGAYGIYAWGIRNDQLKESKVFLSPVCKLRNQVNSTLYYAKEDHQPSMELCGSLFELENNKVEAKVDELEELVEVESEDALIISHHDALYGTKVGIDKEYFMVTDSVIVPVEQGILLYGEVRPRIKCYPTLEKCPVNLQWIRKEGQFDLYEVTGTRNREINCRVTCTKSLSALEKSRYEIELEYEEMPGEEVEDIVLSIRYRGDTAKLLCNHTVIADNFFNGDAWVIGLRRFHYPKVLSLEIQPLYPETKVFLEVNPFDQEGACASLDSVSAETIYVHQLHWS